MTELEDLQARFDALLQVISDHPLIQIEFNCVLAERPFAKHWCDACGSYHWQTLGQTYAEAMGHRR